MTLVDEDLKLPVRHEAIARRVAELVAAELAPGMIPGILAPGAMTPVWEAIDRHNGGRLTWYVNPVPLGGSHILQPQVTVDARTRSIAWTLAVDSWQVWAGTLREL